MALMGTAPPAVYCDGTVLPKLLLGLVHLPDEVYEALSCLGNTLLWPVCELELPDCPRLPILGEVGKARYRVQVCVLGHGPSRPGWGVQ